MGSWDTAGCSSTKVATPVDPMVFPSMRTLFSIAVCTRSASDWITAGDTTCVSLESVSRSTPGSSAGISLCNVGLSSERSTTSLRSSLSQSYLALFLFRNTILPRCSSRAERFAQLWTVVMIAWGIGIFRIVRHFLIAPVTTSNTFCVPWIFPVGPNKIPGKVRPRFVFVMTASSFASTYAPNRPRA